MQRDLVSIIVPIYNAETRLAKCLDSIVKQTYKEIEIILIDDGSTDRSYAICKQFAQFDSRIKLIKQQNYGPSKARNKGICEASGTWLQFVDADDTIHHEMTESMINTSHNIDLVICGYRQDDKLFLPYIEGKKQIKEVTRNLARLHKDVILPSSCNKLYRADSIRKNKIEFPENIFHGEDLQFNLNYLEHVEQVFFIRKALYFYIKNDQSITQKFIPNLYEQQKEVFSNVQIFLEKKHAFTGENKRIIYELIANSIIHSMSNIFHPKSPYSPKEKQFRMRQIILDPFVQKRLHNFTQNFQVRLLRKLLERKAFFRIALLIQTKEFFRHKLNPIFELLKKFVNSRGET